MYDPFANPVPPVQTMGQPQTNPGQAVAPVPNALSRLGRGGHQRGPRNTWGMMPAPGTPWDPAFLAGLPPESAQFLQTNFASGMPTHDAYRQQMASMRNDWRAARPDFTPGMGIDAYRQQFADWRSDRPDPNYFAGMFDNSGGHPSMWRGYGG